MIRVHQVKCDSDDRNVIESHLLRKLNMKPEDLLSWEIHRKSVDARHQKVLFSYVLDCKVRREKQYLKHKDVMKRPDERYKQVEMGTQPMKNRPIVVGFGPAGMFAALLLAQRGYCPIVFERGSKVDVRKEKVESFWAGEPLDESCNVQFGEGGAGAFSDGKLTTRSKDSRARKVLEDLVRFGAKDEILIDSHPHIGTDAFLKIIKACREEIERLGGTFFFDTQVTDIEVKNDTLVGISSTAGDFKCDALIFACGHSASDTILSFYEKGLKLENKPFAVGVRIEHTQKYINEAMLKEACEDPRLIPARYQLTHMASNKKGVYTFCMCPGGYVVSSSSKQGQLVINGMSYAARDGINANSALLVQVNESDYGEDLFAGLMYQEGLEKKAYQMSSSYKPCTQLAKDYLEGKVSTGFEEVEPSCVMGGTFVDLNQLFSPSINQALHEALKAYEEKVPGFVERGAILSAVESRSSSSLKVYRNETLQSNIAGLFPCGEGSGYAGGIMTSAIDGLRCAESLISIFDNTTIKK